MGTPKKDEEWEWECINLPRVGSLFRGDVVLFCLQKYPERSRTGFCPLPQPYMHVHTHINAATILPQSVRLPSKCKVQIHVPHPTVREAGCWGMGHGA